jgi:hypothetical protein
VQVWRCLWLFAVSEDMRVVRTEECSLWIFFFEEQLVNCELEIVVERFECRRPLFLSFFLMSTDSLSHFVEAWRC